MTDMLGGGRRCEGWRKGWGGAVVLKVPEGLTERNVQSGRRRVGVNPRRYYEIMEASARVPSIGSQAATLSSVHREKMEEV